MTLEPRPATASATGRAAGAAPAHVRPLPERQPRRGPGALADSKLVRVLGVYIAVGAGAVQFLDMLVDRFGWSDRVFLMAIIIGVVGMPFTAAAALIRDAVREDRRPASRRRNPADAQPEPAPGTAAHHGRLKEPEGSPQQRTAPALATPDAAPRRSDAAPLGPILSEPAALASHLELALSHRRVAEAHVHLEDHATAAAHLAAFATEAERVRDHLSTLIDEARTRADAARGTGCGVPGRPPSQQ